MLTALQIVDGFLRTHIIHRALVVTSDADPGRGMSEGFPFSATGAALLCRWTDDDYGLDHVHWVNADGTTHGVETFSATVGFADARNVLRFTQSGTMDEEYAEVAAEAVQGCLDAQSVRLSEIAAIIAAPARQAYRSALSSRLGVPADQITIADDQRMHTAALAAGFERQAERLRDAAQLLFVVAGSGVTAGAAVYRPPPPAARMRGPRENARQRMVAKWNN